MTDERYKALMHPRSSLILTEEERELGWHWCNEWDGLLVGPGSSELFCCQCLDKDHPVYETIPKDDGRGRE